MQSLAAGEMPDWFNDLQREGDTAKPAEGVAGKSEDIVEGLEVDGGSCPKHTLLDLDRMFPMDVGDVLSLSPGWIMVSSTVVLPHPEKDGWVQLPLSATSSKEAKST
ncbi:hypothetical protein J6590_071531 [Homalodisca vitripennis]|nr:hypothetical protein J6590_071531 [Homalodisca vitripennis]